MTVRDEVLSVSLNGVDNIGKTTQLGWLHRGLPGSQSVGAIDRWHERWRELAAGDFATWWFESSTTSEHVELVMASHRARRGQSGLLALEDRGLPMLRAACAATAVVKEGLAPDDALRRIDDMIEDTIACRRELHVLLRRSDDPAAEAEAALLHERAPVGPRYARYQHALAEIIQRQVAEGDYDIVLDVGEVPVLDVQRQLRDALATRGLRPSLLPHGPQRLWVLAGLSESGKSTVGELLRDEHGVTRLKIGYLLELAALRAGIDDPYTSWAELEQAERLTEELLRFTEATKAPSISVESAHRFVATEHLRRIWGLRCRVVYVHTADGVRAQRAQEAPAELANRDATKTARGAARIREIADVVLHNDGPRSTLAARVAATVVDAGAHAAPRATAPVSCRAWLEQTTRQLADPLTALVLATGSTGTRSWLPSCSDLDLLVVRDTLPEAWLRTATAAITGPNAVKVAVSAFTTGDVAALRVPPRVVHALRRAADGHGVLHRRDGYVFPVPSAAYDDRASRGELGLVLMTTRRLLADGEFDAHAVYKHTVLLCKILLRADGTDLDESEAVVAAFAAHHPTWSAPPPKAAFIGRPEGHDEHRLRESAAALLDHIDTIDHNPERITVA